MSHRRWGLSLVMTLAASGGEAAAQTRSQADDRPVPVFPREFPSDPPGRSGLRARRSAPPTGFFGRLAPRFDFVQVNVDALGRNMVGDAANEPSIAVDPNDPARIVIGWRQFDDVVSNFRQAGWGYSHDGGHTWTFPGVLEPGVFRSDPVLAEDSQGNFYYNSLAVPGGNFLCDVFRSTDGGVTWGPAMPAFGGDKAWMSIDRSGGIGDGNVYSSWSVFAGCCANDTFTRSTDAAVSFSTPSAIPLTPIFGTMEVGPDGDLFIAGVDPGDFGTFHVARSSDAEDPGLTPSFDFTATVSMNGEMSIGAGPNPGGLLGQADVAIDPQSGDVYLVCSVDPPGSDPLDVYCARSTNGGVSWSAPVRVNDDPTDNGAWQWFGTVSVAPNGRVDVVWNDTRKHGQDDLSQTYYASSTDGGATWSANRAVTPVWNSHVGHPNQAKIGDYYDTRSENDAVHLAFAATFNHEQDVYYLEITP